MSEDVFESIQKNLAAEIEKETERKKRLPINLKVGPRGSLQQAGATAFVEAMRRLGFRDYALDHIGRMEGGAFGVGCIQHKLNIVDALEKLATIVSGWKQDRPPADAGTIPELPIDKATGLRVRNPWLPLPPVKPNETTPHFDHASQAMVREQSSRLAIWLESCAKNGGQPSFAMLDELEAERLEAEHLRKLPYGEAEWQANKLRKDIGATLTEQNLFARSVTDPWLLKFHRTEAKLGSPRIKFNLTHRMQAWHISPQLCEAYKAGEQVFKQWQEQEREKAA